jgi:hypothetical protein
LLGRVKTGALTILVVLNATVVALLTSWAIFPANEPPHDGYQPLSTATELRVIYSILALLFAALLARMIIRIRVHARNRRTR